MRPRSPGTSVKLKTFLVYFAVMVFGGTGDVLLARGMKDLGPVSLAHLGALFTAIFNPWVVLGVVCLIGFFSCYLTALSWADLTYVLPATAMGYVMVAFLSKYFLHEDVTVWRWAGILLITCGVGWVTRGPSTTERAPANQSRTERDDALLAPAGGTRELA